MSRTGRLFLCPAPLDFGCEPPLPAITDVLPAGTLQTMAGLQYWACENAKTLRQLLKRVDEVVPLQHPLQEMQISVLPRDMHKKGDHAGGSARSWQQEARQLLQPALQGHDMGLASEAGMPAVADPGSSLVRAAHEVGIQVVPLTGPSSILLALAASGLNGQNFAFIGYLPQDPAAREKRLKELETLARKTGQAQLWIETSMEKISPAAAMKTRPSQKVCRATLPRLALANCGSSARKNRITLGLLRFISTPRLQACSGVRLGAASCPAGPTGARQAPQARYSR